MEKALTREARIAVRRFRPRQRRKGFGIGHRFEATQYFWKTARARDCESECPVGCQLADHAMQEVTEATQPAAADLVSANIDRDGRHEMAMWKPLEKGGPGETAHARANASGLQSLPHMRV